MKTIARFGGAILLLMMFGAAMASAQTRHPASGPAGTPARDHGCGDELAQFVGLTSAQITSLETLRTDTLQAIEAVATQAKAAHDALDAALALTTRDRCVIGDLAIQVYGVRQQIGTIRSNAEAAFVASLTAEQQAKYATFIAANPGCAALPGHEGPFGRRAR